MLDSVSCEKFTLSWLKGNIFEIAIKDKSFIDVDELKEIQIHKARLTQNKQHGVLFITPGFGNLSKEAREYAASPEASMNCVAKAVITANLGMKILTNFFIVFNKPAVCHKAFSTVNEGLQWLNDQLKVPEGT